MGVVLLPAEAACREGGQGAPSIDPGASPSRTPDSPSRKPLRRLANYLPWCGKSTSNRHFPEVVRKAN